MNRSGCLIVTIATLVFWSLVILLLSSCKPLEIVHSAQMEAVAIDRAKGLVLMKGETLRPKGHYWVYFPLSGFEYVEEGMLFELKQLPAITDRMAAIKAVGVTK